MVRIGGWTINGANIDSVSEVVRNGEFRSRKSAWLVEIVLKSGTIITAHDNDEKKLIQERLTLIDTIERKYVR